MNNADPFRDAIRSAGLEPPDVIEPDGKLHRFASSGKRGDDAGWYVLHGDGIPAGAFGCWRAGVSGTWRADVGRILSPGEEAAHRAKLDAMRREREAEETRRRTEAASKAAAIWNAAQPPPDDHPYLVRKSIKAHGAKVHDGKLVIPLRDGSELHSLQFIDGNGEKRFLTGGRVAGCYFGIGNPKDAAAMCIAEGFATGATIHEVTGYPVAVAFNAGNLEPVARVLRSKFPNLTLILCADDDVGTDGNPGLSKATTAALAVGGKLAVPDFGADRPDDATDFNDMAALRGIEAIKTQIGAAIAEAPKSDDPINAMLEAAGITALQPGASMGVVEESVRTLATMLVGADPIRRATVREGVLKKLAEIGISAPGKLIDAAMPKANRDQGDGSGQALFLGDPEPWADEVNGGALLHEITALIQRYAVLGQESIHAVALWLLHCWALDAFDISPLLGITSPEKRCGKTTLLEIVWHLAPRAVSTANITAAAMFRIVEKFAPTLLVDEADTFLGNNDELRGVLNSGHRRSSAFVVRTVGDDHEPAQFKTWAPKAIALIGKLPATLEDRCIAVAMRRRAPNEIVARFRSSECQAAATPLRQKAFRWASDHMTELRASDPATPPELHDRAADNWRPLLSIADLVGGEWPERARAAALAMSRNADEADGSALIELLVELHTIYELRDRIASAELVEHLAANSDSRWVEYSYGKPISQRQVARLLARLSIKPETIRVGTKTAKGYLAERFVDAFARYLPQAIRNSVTSEQDQSVTPQAIRNMNGVVTDRNSNLSIGNQSNVTDVTDREALSGGIEPPYRQQVDWEDVL